MMVLYSGTTCPFSQRCRFVLFEKGMDFEIRDVDLYNKPEDIAIMNPYGQVPILVERDLILYESNIVNKYTGLMCPHPQLMPADPVMRARARLFLFNFERELFIHVQQLERRDHQKDTGKMMDRARLQIRDRLTQCRTPHLQLDPLQAYENETVAGHISLCQQRRGCRWQSEHAPYGRHWQS